jgi:hypothetical protein
LSDLANSCEYLTSEKLCLAVSDNAKAKASRQVRCKNEEKLTCCYLCMFVLDCAMPCRFLGINESVPQRIDAEKTQADAKLVNDEKPEVEKAKDAEAALCSLCNVEMFQTRTKLSIDGWEGTHPKLGGDDSGKLGEEVLPVIVYLCPKCAKIEFKADKN